LLVKCLKGSGSEPVGGLATESGKGALDDPSARKQYEAFGGVGSFDDFVGPLAVLLERGLGFFTGVAALGERMS
jgi:hypothetical protein